MRIWGALDCSSLILLWLLLGERDQPWNPQKKNVLLNALSQHWPRRPISLSRMETCMVFHPARRRLLSTEWIKATHTTLWMPTEPLQLAPAKDRPFHVLVVRKPVSEILQGFGRSGKWVLEISQLRRISLVFIHICKNVFQASCTVISNLYCSLLAVLTTYIANILLQLRKSVNNCRKQEFRTCMYCFFYIKALQLKVQGKMLL